MFGALNIWYMGLRKELSCNKAGTLYPITKFNFSKKLIEPLFRTPQADIESGKLYTYKIIYIYI